jgi:aquaporin Z
MFRRYVAEFLGTFFLMFAIIFFGEAWAIGLMFGVMIYIGGHVSGGYYNPAVAGAAWARGALSMEHLIGYSIAQILGATMASLYFLFISGDHFTLELPAGIMFSIVAVREILLTFVLAMIVLTMMTTIKYRGSHLGGLICGVALAAIASVGGLYNPAIFLGAAICNMTGAIMPTLPNLLTFVGAPLIGSGLAVGMFKYFNPTEV